MTNLIPLKLGVKNKFSANTENSDLKHSTQNVWFIFNSSRY